MEGDQHFKRVQGIPYCAWWKTQDPKEGYLEECGPITGADVSPELSINQWMKNEIDDPIVVEALIKRKEDYSDSIAK